MKLFLKCVFALFLCFFHTACGLLEFYYLPQVPDIDIRNYSLTGVDVRLQNLTASYADGYRIYYKIYISEYNHTGETIPPVQYNLISSVLVQDYNQFLNLSDPSTTSIMSNITTFTNRGFREMNYAFSGGVDSVLASNVNTVFRFLIMPTANENPVIIINNGSPANLLRSQMIGESIEPFGNLYFNNTPELNASYAGSIENINADVSVTTIPDNALQRNAYVSMYIFATGYNYDTFEIVYSKPTHLGIFILP